MGVPRLEVMRDVAEGVGHVGEEFCGCVVVVVSSGEERARLLRWEYKEVGRMGETGSTERRCWRGFLVGERDNWPELRRRRSAVVVAGLGGPSAQGAKGSGRGAICFELLVSWGEWLVSMGDCEGVGTRLIAERRFFKTLVAW